MAAVTGELSIDLRGVSNTNAYLNPNITLFGDALRVFDEKFRVWDFGGVLCFGGCNIRYG